MHRIAWDFIGLHLIALQSKTTQCYLMQSKRYVLHECVLFFIGTACILCEACTARIARICNTYRHKISDVSCLFGRHGIAIDCIEFHRSSLDCIPLQNNPCQSKEYVYMCCMKVSCCSVDCVCLLYTSPSPRDRQKTRMPSSA